MTLGLVGCHSGAIDDRANEEIADVRARAEHRAIYPTCADKAPLGAGCGMLLAYAGTEEYRARFRAAWCVSADEAECQARFQRAIDGWLARRYFAADWGSVADVCDRDPTACADPKHYELLLVESHNAAVRDRAARDEDAIEARRAREHRADAARTIAVADQVLGEVAYAAHRGPKCRSYPSVFSGVTSTICTP